MNCYRHIEVSSVATCSVCPRTLCSPCEGLFQPPLCDRCAAQDGKIGQQNVIKKYVVNAAAAIIGLVIGAHDPFPVDIILGIYFMVIPSGWRALTSIQPRMFLFMSFPGWIIYFVIKGWVSMIIGLVAFPVSVYQDIKRFQRSKEVIEIARAQTP